MRITVNDLAFEFPLYEKVRTMQAVKKFVSICRKLESIQCHNVERLVRTEIDKEKELYPTGKLYRIIREIPDKDERKYFLGLLVNREKSAVSEEACFIYKHLKSYACAAAREEALVSLETEEGFKKKEIEGSINGEIVRIKNISCEEHVNDYWSLLGIRIYEANVAKHKKDRENAYGKGKIGSPMDLSDEEAQELLDHAIWVNEKLYARKGNRNYAFQNTQNCVYHGYIADDLGDDILTELYRRKWE